MHTAIFARPGAVEVRVEARSHAQMARQLAECDGMSLSIGSPMTRRGRCCRQWVMVVHCRGVQPYALTEFQGFAIIWDAGAWRINGRGVQPYALSEFQGFAIIWDAGDWCINGRGIQPYALSGFQGFAMIWDAVDWRGDALKSRQGVRLYAPTVDAPVTRIPNDGESLKFRQGVRLY
ncbi:MAG: hypothetical protein AAF327_21000, partial [Cyanobacteria bacterium P01_A01_bin.37]